MQLLVLAALLAALTWLGEGDPLEGGVTLLNEITRGKRATHAPYNAAGVVPFDPSDLALQAGTTLDVYAMARMIASEEGSSDNATKAAVAWCLVNQAAHEYTTIVRLLLRAKNPDHNGFFGTQKDIDKSSAGFGNSDRYASTALDPYDGEITIAQGVLDGSIPDPTSGCQQFDRPAGEKNPDQVAAKRIAAGAELVTLADLPDIRFWRT